MEEPQRPLLLEEMVGRVMDTVPSNHHITYQLQYRKCGKPSCRTCRSCQGHGPYWYAYWRDGSRLRSAYIGKVRPASLDTSPDCSTPESTLEAAADVAREEPPLGEESSGDLYERYLTEPLPQAALLSP